MDKTVEQFQVAASQVSAAAVKSATQATRVRYDRIAPVYDLMEWFTEQSAFQKWRRELWAQIQPGRILEVGVGTGRNISYYPQGSQVTAIDLSQGMLARAQRLAASLRANVDLQLMDVQHLAFPDNTYDTAMATFVFCSVPIPIQGLRQLGRVVKPGGDIWLLEHVRVNKPVVGALMDGLNPLVVRVMGANINRQTVENVKQAGLQVLEVKDLSGEMVKLIHARPSK